MKKSSTAFKASLLVSAIHGLLLTQAQAATVTDQIDYQIFRDFAENKGEFTPGATNIAIHDKDGNFLDLALPNGVAMPDMSPSNVNTGILTLIGEQFTTTAQHNDDGTLDHQPIRFGNNNGFIYTVDSRNDAEGHYLSYDEIQHLDDSVSDPKYNDIAMPRLNKMVTEVAPAAHLNNPNGDLVKEDDTYIAFARTGSGIQGTVDGSDTSDNLVGQDNKAPAYTYLATAYQYLVGGGIPRPAKITNAINDDVDPPTIGQYLQTTPFNYRELATGIQDENGEPLGISPLNTHTERGDSGSALYGYNQYTNRWEVIGVVNGGFGDINPSGDYEESDTWTIFDHALYNKFKNQYYAGTLQDINYRDYTWENTGLINDENLIKTATGAEKLRFANGKDLYINQNANITLAENIIQGTGGLYIGRENPLNAQETPVDVTIKGQNDQTSWLGSGILVGKGSTATLQINTAINDTLAKLGQGTLIINAKGNGLGDINVGDGTVILNQQADALGAKRAFDQVNIVSGRGTVILSNAEQLGADGERLDNVHFGFRGGRLDVNGNSLTGEQIRHDDDGAMLVNHNANTAATITLTGRPQINADGFGSVTTDNGNIYIYRGDRLIKNPTTGEFVPTTVGNYYPTTPNDSLEFIYIGNENTDSNETIFANYNNYINSQRLITTFAGKLGETDTSKHNGKLNLTFAPTERTDEAKLLLTGGSNLNGNITATKGTVILSGRPTSHAVDWQTRSEVMPDDDWLNRTYTANNLVAQNNANIYVGRNVSDLNANILAQNTASVNIGYNNGITPVCVRSEFHYEAECTLPRYDNAVLATIPVVNAKSDVILQDSASLNLYRANLTGKIQGADGTSVSVGNGKWTMTENSRFGKLTLDNGIVQLNPSSANAVDSYNTLAVKQLTGKGQLNYLTDLASFKGDKVLVSDLLEGNFTLSVADKGGEPVRSKEHLTLLDAAQANRTANVNLASPVNLGAYKYTLSNDNGIYYLSSPVLEQEIDTPPVVEQPQPPVEQPPAEQPEPMPEQPPVVEPQPELPPAEQPEPMPEQPPVVEPQPELPPVEQPEPMPEQPPVVEPEPQPEQPPVVEPQPELPPVEQPEPMPEQPPVVEPEPQPEQPPVVEQPQLELPPVVIPPAEQPKPTKPLFYQQKNITSDLANLTLTDLLEKSQQSSRIHNLQLARVLHDEGENVWVNATRLDTKGKETPWVSGYERTDEQLQIGAKHTVNNSTGRATFGAAYTRNNSDSSYRGQNYTADGKLDLGSVFFKQQFDDQTYVTFDGGYGKDKTTIKAMGQQSDVKRDVATAGFNVGKTYSSVIDIEPSIGVRYDRLDGADYSIAGASVQAPSLDLISYRAGVNLSKTMVLASGATVQPGLSSNYVKASDKTSYLRFNDVGFAQSYGDYHYHDAGVKVGMGNFGIALKGTYAKGEDIQEQKGGTLQLSYKW